LFNEQFSISWEPILYSGSDSLNVPQLSAFFLLSLNFEKRTNKKQSERQQNKGYMKGKQQRYIKLEVFTSPIVDGIFRIVNLYDGFPFHAFGDP